MSKPPQQRMCQGCRQMAPKNDLQRLVRAADGQIKWDKNHEIAGRGFHFHSECANRALVAGKVTHFLRVESDEQLKILLEQIKQDLISNVK